MQVQTALLHHYSSITVSGYRVYTHTQQCHHYPIYYSEMQGSHLHQGCVCMYVCIYIYIYVAVTGRKRTLGPMPYLGVVVYYYRPQLPQARVVQCP